MSIVAQNNPFPFIKLPHVMQTMVTSYVPKNDLGINAVVSKQFKTIVEGNLIWEKFAKEMQIDIKDHQNVKQECITKYGEEIKKANATIIAILPEKEKAKISAMNNPFDQKKEIISCLRDIMETRFQNRSAKVYSDIENLVIRTGSYFQFSKQSLANKVILRTLYEGVGSTLRTTHLHANPFLGGPFFCRAGEKDPEIYKAYIKGCKEMSQGNPRGLFEEEITHAVEKRSPMLLKLLLKEEASINIDRIYEVFIMIVFPQSDLDKKCGNEMLSVIIEGIPHHKEILPEALNFAEEMVANLPLPDPMEEAQYKAKEQIKEYLYSTLKK